jgi:hypothetical protein
MMIGGCLYFPKKEPIGKAMLGAVLDFYEGPPVPVPFLKNHNCFCFKTKK